MAWKAQRTLLIVGEGADDVAFLNHVKQLTVTRGCGLLLKIKNAQGKGARHIVEWTVRQMAFAKHDTVAVLVNTDTDWSDLVTRLATKRRISFSCQNPVLRPL